MQNHVTGALPTVSGTSDEGTHFDGYSCALVGGQQAFQASMESPEWAAVVEDGDNVFDMAVAPEHERTGRGGRQIAGPASPYKVVWM